MKNIKLTYLINLIVFFIIFQANSYSFESRGLKAVYRNYSGEIKNIQLYTEGCHALVIGVSHYRAGWPFLPNPIKDAEEISEMLKSRGWSVELLSDPDSSELNSRLNRLAAGPGRKIDRAVIVWFSGHGCTLQEADGSKLGYLVPSDAPDPDCDLAGFMDKAVSMRKIETISRNIMSRHVMMIFDSCFSGAIFQLVRAKPSSYIQEKIKHPVREFITAGMEDEQVPDKSLFKEIFIQSITDGFGDLNKDGFITGEELGFYIQENVINYSRSRQHPQFGKINNPRLDKGDIIFKVIEKLATLSVYCNVHNADIYIDNLKLDESSAKNKPISPGIYNIRTEKEGYYPYKKVISIEAGQHYRLEAELNPKKTDPLNNQNINYINKKVERRKIKPKFLDKEDKDVKRKFYPTPSF